MTTTRIPGTVEFLWPTIQALRSLGGSGRIDQINDAVVESEGFTDEQLTVVNPKGRPYIHYRVDWARTMLKRMGVTDNSTRGVWTLTEFGWSIDENTCRDMYAKDMTAFRENRSTEGTLEDVRIEQSVDEGDVDDEALDGQEDWKSTLIDQILAMNPTAFERLAQRLLLEAGFLDVKVTGRSGDGGIDGVGVYRFSLISFPVHFQCKRYSGTVPPRDIREFRGAIIGRESRGLLITTGDFSKNARDEAVREGAVPIDLVDGDALCDLLKQYELGVSVELKQEEVVNVRPNFFEQF